MSAAGLAAALALIPGAVSAAGRLDQQQTAHGGSSDFVNVGNSVAQTFTAGLTGALDQVDLMLSDNGGTAPVTVEIRNVTGTGTAGTTVLATTSVAAAAVPDDGLSPVTFVSAPFTTPASVVAGTAYSIVVYSEASTGTSINGYTWATNAESYAGGQAFHSDSTPPAANSWRPSSCGIQNDSCDTAFKTYVTPSGAIDTPLVVDKTALDFGNVTVGTTSAPLSIALTNTSSAPYGPLSGFGGAPPNFPGNAYQDCQGATLPAGGSCHLFYTFAPTTTGRVNSTSDYYWGLGPTSNDDEHFHITLTGVGVDPHQRPTATCFGLAATIVGTNASETLRGTAGPDVIAGLGGKDRIRGLGGNDTICGGTGRDSLSGGSGSDKLYGGSARDRLYGGKGSHDVCNGGTGDDKSSDGCEHRTSADRH